MFPEAPGLSYPVLEGSALSCLWYHGLSSDAEFLDPFRIVLLEKLSKLSLVLSTLCLMSSLSLLVAFLVIDLLLQNEFASSIISVLVSNASGTSWVNMQLLCLQFPRIW